MRFLVPIAVPLVRVALIFLSAMAFSKTVPGETVQYQAEDDTGQVISLDSRPNKIVSLSPHLTEILFSLGVGEKIIATVHYSDYPDAARQIPRLGDAFSISVEAIVALAPDLILAWTTGGNQRTLQQLKELGYPIYLNEAGSLAGVASTVERIGQLVGRSDTASKLAREFIDGLNTIEIEQRAKPEIRVFFQIADTQLYTVNNQHLIGQALAVCGAENIFAEVSIAVPMVSFESVVEQNPDFIVVAAPYEGFVSKWSSEWEMLGWSSRVRYLDASLITRPGLRMLEGIKSLCKTLRE